MSLMLSQPKIDLVSPVEAVAAFRSAYRGARTADDLSRDAQRIGGIHRMARVVVAPPELDMQPGAHGEILRLMGPRFQPFTTFNYRVRASATGEFTVPEFTVTVHGKPVVVPATSLTVSSNEPAPPQPGSRLEFELPTTNLYVGQAVKARAILPGAPGGLMQGLTQVQLTGDDFLVDVGGARQRIEMGANGAGRIPNYVYEASLTPVASGKLSVFAQGSTTGQRFGGAIILSGGGIVSPGPPQYTLLESEPIAVSVRPLPQEGKLPGFAGAIGNLALGSVRLSTNLADPREVGGKPDGAEGEIANGARETREFSLLRQRPHRDRDGL